MEEARLAGKTKYIGLSEVSLSCTFSSDFFECAIPEQCLKFYRSVL